MERNKLSIQFNWLKMLDGMNRPEIYPIGSTPKGRQSKGEAKLEISCQSSLICKYVSLDWSNIEKYPLVMIIQN